MPQLDSSDVNVSYQANDFTNLHFTETVNANSNKTISIPSVYSASKHPQNLSISIKYKDGNAYKDASLFACADVNSNDTITVYNDSETNYTLYISVFG